VSHYPCKFLSESAVINIHPVNFGEASWKSENSGTRRHGHGQARMLYLDVIRRIKDAYAYHVSGEYAMRKAVVRNGWLDSEPACWRPCWGSSGRGRMGW